MNSTTLDRADLETDPRNTPEQTDTNMCCGAANLPSPTKEHAWLQQFVGDWDAEIEAHMPAGKPSMVTRGSDSSRMLGGFWLVSEGRNHEFPYVCLLTLGYDADKKKYVGTWADSMAGFLWHYEGTVDATGRIISLETEGPNFMADGKRTKFREVTEFKSVDHRVFTSSRRAENGEWVNCLTIHFRRKR